MRWAGAGRAWYLVEQEGPHARHAATVVHHCRDVTGERKMCEAGVCPPCRPKHSRAPGVEGGRTGEMGGCPWRPESGGKEPIMCHLLPDHGPREPQPPSAGTLSVGTHSPSASSSQISK